MKNELGKRYGKLIVISRVGKLGSCKQIRWLCKCDCGNTIETNGENLRNGKTRRCHECLAKDRQGQGNPHFKGGHYRDRLYHVWISMKQRCNNPHNRKYKHYGGRGISICPEWMEYETFRSWAYANGYDDSAIYGKTTLDRIDVNGNYEPSNCRFADLYVQNKNRRPFSKAKIPKEDDK